MKNHVLSVMLLSCMCSLHAMELFDSWNSPSSKRNLSDEEKMDNSLHAPQMSNSRTMLINSILADNDTGVVLALIEYPDLNVSGQKYGRDDPPLCIAAGQGHRTVLESLLVNRATVEVCDGNGDSPLHYATRFGHLTAAKVLVRHGASLEAKNMWGQTVLHQALEEAPLNIDLIRWLLKRGANVNAQDEEGKSGAHYACMHDREDLLELLRERNDVQWDLEDEDGITPKEMPLLAYYIPPPPPPSPQPEQCTISYANLDDLFGTFYTDETIEQQVAKAHDQEDLRDDRNRTIHTYYCLPSLEVDDADDEFDTSDDAFDTARDEFEGPPPLLAKVTSQDDQEEEISWDSE